MSGAKLAVAAACGAGLASIAWYLSAKRAQAAEQEVGPHAEQGTASWMPLSFRLDNKVAFITGGARDFGFEMAEGLAEAGCSLILTSRSVKDAQAAAAKLMARFNPESHADGIQVYAMALDVRDYKVVATAAEEAIQWKGHVDIVINNAGGSPGAGGGLFERDPKDIEELIQLNLLGTVWICKAFGLHMASLVQDHRNPSPKIINIASIAGLCGRDSKMYENLGMRRQPVDYAAAKGGVISFTRDFAAIMGPMGVRVNAISPGGFGPREPGPPAQFWKDYSARTCLGRPGRDGKDLKGLVLFLASSASDYVHGENVVLDGGFSIYH